MTPDPFSTITNPAAVACACANAARTAAGPDRVALSCVKLEANADEIVMTTTDSYIALVQRLVVCREPRMDHTNGRGTWSALVTVDDLRLVVAAVRGVKDASVDLARSDDGVLVSVEDREVLLPDQDWEYPDVGQFFTGEATAIRGLKVTAGLVRDVGSLQLPGVKADALVVSWRFGGSQKPIAFAHDSVCEDLSWRGVFIPAETVPLIDKDEPGAERT